MICLRCDGETFRVGESAIEQEFWGATITVQSSASFCVLCGWRTLAVGQGDELFKKTIAAYLTIMAKKFSKPEPGE